MACARILIFGIQFRNICRLPDLLLSELGMVGWC